MTWLRRANRQAARDLAAQSPVGGGEAPKPAPFLRPERYEILRQLRSGHDKKVYLGRDRHLDCLVAIDLFANNSVTPTGLTVSAWETRVLGQLGDHRNIATVLDHWETEAGAVMVTRYLAGGSLKDKLSRTAQAGEVLPLDNALRIATEIARALEHIHGRRRAMLETCGSAGKGWDVKEGVPSR